MKNAFSVSPMSQKINLKPGETYEGSIMVANPKAATEDFYYKVTIYPYFIKGDSYETDFETVSDWSRIVDWTTLDHDSGVLKPNDMEKIKFTIKVPENTPGGGQYMMLGVSSDNPIEENGGANIQNIYEMASLVYAKIEGAAIHEGQILENQIPGFVIDGLPSVSTKIVNAGNVHETAEIRITVKNNFNGETIYPKDNEENSFEVIVMPESTREIKKNITNLPPLGVFEVNETVSYMETEMGTTAVIVVCPAWFVLLVVATLVSIIGMAFYGRHLKRKKLQKTVDF